MSTTSRRPFIAAAAALACSTLLAAWAPLAQAQTVDEIKKKGTLTVGMLVDFPPYGTVDTSNNPDGYDADVAKAATTLSPAALTWVVVGDLSKVGASVRALQLGVYRLAWSRLTGTALDHVRAAFYYADSGETVWPDLLDEAERNPAQDVSPVLLDNIADRLEAVAAALEEDGATS